MTNLKNVNDHPVRVLNTYAADAYGVGNVSYGDHYSTAATRLGGYELENDVTFAALDNATLELVRDMYSAMLSSTNNYYALDIFIASTRDLLGLDDDE